MKKQLLLLLLVLLLGCENQIVEPLLDNFAVPKQPEYVSPKNFAETDSIVVLRWHVSEGAESYILQIAKDSLFSVSEIIVNKSIKDSNVYIFSECLPQLHYYWRVFAVNSNGVSNPKDAVWMFKRGEASSVLPHPPGSPELLTPLNNTKDINMPVKYLWKKVAGIDYYQLELAEDSAFTNIRYRSEYLNSEQYTMDDLPENKQFFWRVKAINQHGTSISSSYNSFTTKSLLAVPATVNLLTPATDSTQISIPTVFAWAKSLRAASYTIQIALDVNFTKLMRNISGLIDTTITIDSLDQLSTYYWRVSAENGSGTSGFLNIKRFKTKFYLGAIYPCPDAPEVVYEGRTYHTVQIGDQCWLKENLNAGVVISDSSTIPSNNGIIEKRCYKNQTINCEKYGGLYLHGEITNYVNDTTGFVRGICPEGWHIPSRTEFGHLLELVGNSNNLKAIGTGTGAGAGTDGSGFSLLLGGYYRGIPYSTSYNDEGVRTFLMSKDWKFNSGGSYYWIYLFEVKGNDSLTQTLQEFSFNQGSVRCLKNN